MSVIVTDMDMPKTCKDCRFKATDWTNDMGAFFTYWMDCRRKEIEPKKKPDWCPLKEYKGEL